MGIERKKTAQVIHHHREKPQALEPASMTTAEAEARQLLAAEAHREKLLRQHTEKLGQVETLAEKSAILCHRAHIYLLQKNTGAALSDFNAAEAFHAPLRTTAYLHRAALHYNAGNQAEAERDMTQALDQLQPTEYQTIKKIQILYAMKKNQALIDSILPNCAIGKRLRMTIAAFEQPVAVALRQPSENIATAQMAIAPSVMTTHYQLLDLAHSLNSMTVSLNQTNA